MRRALAALAVLLLTGCGLPLTGGVQAPRTVPEEQPRAGAVSVIPPGPEEDATPEQVVRGFLGAQSSPEGDHAVARQFLLPGTAWDDRARVEVYDPATLESGQEQGSEVVTVTARRTARVGEDGAYRRDGGTILDPYLVRRDQNGQWRLAKVPAGLRLTSLDLGRSFAPRDVHFLAPPYGEASSTGHLVADRVWLPVVDDLPQLLVDALLRGPSSALGGSVLSAVPPGTTRRAVRASVDGTITVDLDGPLGTLAPAVRERLSAQLVWTLRSAGNAFSRLRLLAGGQPYEVDGTTEPQEAGDWQEYDPERLRSQAPAFYLSDRQLRSLDGGLATSAATEGTLPVDEAAASPDGFLALLTRRGPRDATLSTGPQAGPFSVRLTGDLSSPTYGSGEQGLWLLRRAGGQTRLLLLPPQGPARLVEVEGLEDGVRLVRVARDGVRIAFLTGEAGRGRLLLGRISSDGAGRPTVEDVREVTTAVRGATDVAFASGTSMVVLTRFPFGQLPARLAVDGSSLEVLDSRLQQDVEPVSVTAAAGRPTVLAGRLREDGAPAATRLFRDEGRGVFVPQPGEGSAPFYPG